MNKPWTMLKLFAGLCKSPNSPNLYWPLLFLARTEQQKKDNEKLFTESEIWERVQKENLNLMETMQNLDNYKKGSVAEFYKAFCVYWNIDTEEYFGVGSRPVVEPRHVMLQRQLASHDLAHVILGYDGSLKGEMQVVTFQYGQSKNIGFLLIALAISWRYISSPYLMWKAYWRGKRTMRLETMDWETVLRMKVSEIQRMFA